MRKSYRVKSEQDFQRVFEHGCSVANRNFVIYKKANAGVKHFRVGISVGKKVGHTAVLRNKIKRMIRADLLNHRAEIDPGLDFLVIARPSCRSLNHEELERNLMHALSLAGIVQGQSIEIEEQSREEATNKKER